MTSLSMLPIFLRWIFLGLALLGTVTSTVYLLLVIIAAAKFMLRRRSHLREAMVEDLPPLSLLKPVHGAEPLLDVNISSCIRQSYPADYEVLLCARHFSDPAFGVVDQVMKSLPSDLQVKVRKIECGEPIWVNPKVWSLERMLQSAKYPFVVITDSDVQVGEDFLRSIASDLKDPAVGLVTCLYRGVPTGGPWSRLEAIGMSVELTSGVLVAEMLEGMQFSLAPCMATKKTAISAIGGLVELSECYADDFVLGNKISKAGLKVVLADYVINHVVTNQAFLPSIRHQLGWMRSTRFSRPKGHIGTVLTFAMPYAILGAVSEAVLGNWKLGIVLLGWGIANRIVQAILVGWGVTRDKESLKGCLIYPLRDLMGFVFWIWSYLGNGIGYRGEFYTFYDDGKIRLKEHRRHQAELLADRK